MGNNPRNGDMLQITPIWGDGNAHEQHASLWQ